MPPRPGNLNPDSKAGNARLGTGRGSNSGRSQPSGANKAVGATKKLQPPVGSTKPSNLSKFFSEQQKKRNQNAWNKPSVRGIEAMYRRTSGPPAGRGGIGGIRAGQRKAE